jgi:hypothetical protein
MKSLTLIPSTSPRPTQQLGGVLNAKARAYYSLIEVKLPEAYSSPSCCQGLRFLKIRTWKRLPRVHYPLLGTARFGNLRVTSLNS